MEKSKKEDNKSWGLVTALIIVLLITTAVCGYFVGAYKFTNSLIKERREANSEIVKEETVEPEEETTKEEVKSPYRTCVGTYKGTGPVSVDAQTKEITTGEYSLSLKEDGTFEYSTGMAKEIGNYVVIDNTLIFMYTEHTTGPKDKVPSIVAATYVISDDCSKILFDSLASKDKVNLVKQ